jgi:hypothetical protein
LTPLRADTPTETPQDTLTSTITPSVTPTCTLTPGVGEGTWTFVASAAPPWVTGSNGLSAILTYYAGATPWPPSGGLLSIYFPPGLDAPSAVNFYAVPTPGGNNLVQGPGSYSYSGASPNGSTVSVDVSNLASGAPVSFYYGYDSGGFAISTTVSPLVIAVQAYADSTTGGPGAAVAPNGANVPLVVVTPTLTCTVTLSSTISPTFSPSPTISPTPTITLTSTNTPIGTVTPNAVYSYPNPFDMRAGGVTKCTFRFPSDSSAKVTVFNLVGEPVREIPSSDINLAEGWAIWPGVDDYLRPVAGGIYFVRVRASKGTYIKHFTVLH